LALFEGCDVTGQVHAQVITVCIAKIPFALSSEYCDDVWCIMLKVYRIPFWKVSSCREKTKKADSE